MTIDELRQVALENGILILDWMTPDMMRGRFRADLTDEECAAVFGMVDVGDYDEEAIMKSAADNVLERAFEAAEIQAYNEGDDE